MRLVMLTKPCMVNPCPLPQLSVGQHWVILSLKGLTTLKSCCCLKRLRFSREIMACPSLHVSPSRCLPIPSPPCHACTPVLRSASRKRHICMAATASASAGDAGDLQPSSSSSSQPNSSSAQQQQQRAGPLQWLKDRLGSSKLDKQKLAQYGMGTCCAWLELGTQLGKPAAVTFCLVAVAMLRRALSSQVS